MHRKHVPSGKDAGRAPSRIESRALGTMYLALLPAWNARSNVAEAVRNRARLIESLGYEITAVARATGPLTDGAFALYHSVRLDRQGSVLQVIWTLPVREFNHKVAVRVLELLWKDLNDSTYHPHVALKELIP